MSQQEKTLSVLRRQQVQERTGLSRSSIYHLIKHGAFPRQIQLSARSVGWLSNEIDTWLSTRIAKSIRI